jgi:peptidoglycan/xylan/chitin deacetylase (PgdA/CDA1 family)
MKKRCLLIAPAFLLFGVAIIYQISRSSSFQLFGEIIPRVDTTQKVVALTFDDGPTAGATEQLLGILAAEDVKATFFVTGAELEKNLQQGKMIVAAGHELGNHTYSHERMVFVTPAFVRQEVERTDQLIRDAGYGGEIYFRPPFGKKLLTLPYYLARTERKTVTWDVEPDSYPDIASDSDKIAQYVLAKARPGSIIILHVMYKRRAESMKSVKKVIDGLREKGYSFKTVSELLAVA